MFILVRPINCSLSHKISIRFKNTEGALSRSHSVFKSLPQCFEIAPSVFLNRSHSVFVQW